MTAAGLVTLTLFTVSAFGSAVVVNATMNLIIERKRAEACIVPPPYPPRQLFVFHCLFERNHEIDNFST